MTMPGNLNDPLDAWRDLQDELAVAVAWAKEDFAAAAFGSHQAGSAGRLEGLIKAAHLVERIRQSRNLPATDQFRELVDMFPAPKK